MKKEKRNYKGILTDGKKFLLVDLMTKFTMKFY